ncbi:CYTH and CHAD domain-containing protein [soil metagenome]
MSSRHLETERTYELAGAGVPDLVAGTDAVIASVDDLGTVQLEATYVDTADLSLLARRVTLRRRLGGDDAGWHLKLPPEDDTRQEVHWPPGAYSEIPAAVQHTVTSLVLGRSLQPVVSLATTRHRSVLRTDDGTPLAEVCDDRVAATVLLDRPAGSRAPAAESVTVWREIEVELMAGDEAVLDLVHDALLAAGAQPSAYASKLARALAEHVMPAPPLPADHDSGSAGVVVLEYLHEHLEALRAADLSWRLDEDGDGVHDLRVQARRLRTALAVYRPIFDEQIARRLQGDLTQLGRELSMQRDLQVERAELLQTLDGQDTQVTGSVAELAERRRSSDDATARAATRTALASRRYVELLTDLEALTSGAALSPVAGQPATSVLPGLLRRAHDRLRRRARRAQEAAVPEERREALHDLRKSAKRLRYANEAAGPALGKDVRRLRKRAARVQSDLGHHGDAHALAGWLYELSRADGVDAHVGFALGALHAAQLEAAQEAERSAARSVRRLLALG